MSTTCLRFATSSQRLAVFSLAGGECHYCGVEINFKGFHVDHRLPFSGGGLTEMDNLVASCYMCNGAKHTMKYSRFKYLLSVNGVEWRRRRYFAVRSNFLKL